jgi:hypothetical protein
MAQAEGAQIQGNIIGQQAQQQAQAQQQVQQQAQAQQQAQQQAQPARGQQQAPVQLAGQPIQINTNGSLKGNASTPFNRTRAKSTGFLLAFDLFRAANRHNNAIANPFSRITTALTYMTDDAIEAWKEDQLNILMGRVNTGILETDEQLWDLFEADF